MTDSTSWAPTSSSSDRPSRAAAGLAARGLDITWGSRTYIMGILNVTPDSFSGDGTGADNERAIERAMWMIEAGADIIDIGGESTRPGALPLDPSEELDRVLPVVQAVRARTRAPISIDTYKSAVAEAALDCGADMVNDVWALRADNDMAVVVARRGVPIVLMHNRSDPKHLSIEPGLGGHYVGVEYEDLVGDIVGELDDSVNLAVAAGVRDEQIILDPGLGFGKTHAQNLELIARLDEIRRRGYPLLVGPSRKSFIGLTLDLGPQDRTEGTAAAVAVAITRGADIVRVHDVDVMSRVVRMTDAIVRR